MAEWLRRLTRNQLGISRTGSNPVRSENFLRNLTFKTIFYTLSIVETNHKKLDSL